VNEAQKKLARHALGLSTGYARGGKSYRNRYIAGQCHKDFDDMVGDGLATYERGVYYMTRKGAELALLPGETLCGEDFPE